MNQTRGRIQYDTNYCGEVANESFVEYRTTEFCDFCTPNLINNSWSDWLNISCLDDDTMNQTRGRTQYDTNYCGEVDNETFVEYRTTEFCDFCTPSWVLNDTWSKCDITNHQYKNRYDINGCDELFVDNNPLTITDLISASADFDVVQPDYWKYYNPVVYFKAMASPNFYYGRLLTAPSILYDDLSKGFGQLFIYIRHNKNVTSSLYLEKGHPISIYYMDEFNNSKTLDIRLPELNITSDFSKFLYISKDGATYYNVQLTSDACTFSNGCIEENKPPRGVRECEQLKTFNINLHTGWNLVSIPLELENEILPAPLKSIEGNYSDIFTYANSWVNLKNGSKIDENMGFWIKMLKNDTLVVKGREVINYTYDMPQGEYIMGYPSLNSIIINENFNFTIKAYKSGWYTYDPARPSFLNTLDALESGYGYWVNAKDATTLPFPSDTFSS